MKRLRSVLLLAILMPGYHGAGMAVFFQAGATRPLTYEKVRDLWRYERTGTLDKGITLGNVEKFGVDFEVDSGREEELRSAGMGQDVINRIKRQVRTGTLTVECGPVECDVIINEEAAGRTLGGVFTKAQVMAGPVMVEVRALSYERQSAKAQLAAGERKKLDRFSLEPVKGTLKVNCEPEDCSFRIAAPSGVTKESTAAEHRLEAGALPSGEYAVEVHAEGYKPKALKVFILPAETTEITVSLDVDEWARITELQFLDQIILSLGGEAALRDIAKSQSAARMTLTGDPAGIGNYKGQVIESAILPDKLRWDMTIASTKWSVTASGLDVWSDGDKRYKGTEFGQELEYSILQFAGLRLPALLPFIRSGFDLKKDRAENGFILTASSQDERYTLRTNHEYRPVNVLREMLIGPRSQIEMEFAQYRKVKGGAIVPHAITLRYPDRPRHEQYIQYDRIESKPSIKDSLFKSPSGLRRLLQGK